MIFNRMTPRGYRTSLLLTKQQVKGEKQATKNIEITLKPGKIRDSYEDNEYISTFFIP